MRCLVGSMAGRFTLLFLLLLPLVSGCTAEMKARAYAGGDRDDWQQPDRVIEELGISAGQSVADIGSGGGYFTFRLSDAVGDTGRVYAVDVDAHMNARLEALAQERGATNVVVVLADFDDPKIGEQVDLIFTSNTYHHIDERIAYFERAASYLKPAGRLAILEYKQEGFFHRILGHATEDDIIVSELEQAGYTLSKKHEFIEQQSFLIFDRPTESN
jgi:arsenite methyltransferase